MDNKELSDYVLAAFRERVIPIKREDVEAALEDRNTRAWLRDHIGPETLLSKEELTLYTKLESTALPHGQETATVRPILDEELRTAIESLKASTAAIDKQTQTLKLQCKELSSQLRNAKQSGQQEEKIRGQLLRNHTLEKQHADVAIEDITHDFETKLAAAQGLLAAENSPLVTQVSSLLKDDDRILKTLEKMGSNLQTGENDMELSNRASKLAKKLAGYMAEEEHLRLDRIYLETIQDEGEKLASSGGDEYDQIAGLEEEIKSLYSEIAMLSDMSTEQQFRTPIARALRTRHGEAHTLSGKQMDYILDTLSKLTESSNDLTARLRNRHSHRMAVHSLATTYKSEVIDERETTQSANKQKLMRRKTVRSSHMPSTPGPNAEQRDASADEGVQALETLLRRLGVSLPALLDPNAPRTTSEVLNEKKERMLELLESSQSTADLPVAAALASVDSVSQLLSNSLHADSKYGVSLSDTDQDARLKALEDQIAVLRRGIDGPVSDASLLGDKTRERFMERWS